MSGPVSRSASRDLLLIMGFLRKGQMHPSVLAMPVVEPNRSLKSVQDTVADHEITLFGQPAAKVVDADDMRRRSAMTDWHGDQLVVSTRVGEVPDPGVVLCLLYDVPTTEAPLPVEVFAQTLRRYVVRDEILKLRFDEHVRRAGTFVPSWISPEEREQRSQDAFKKAMTVAREQGFAHAAPLLEGVRGSALPRAQVALAVYELRELGDRHRALRRLNDVIRMAPRDVAARMQRAGLLANEAGSQSDAALDYIAILKEQGRPDGVELHDGVRQAALDGVWKLSEQFAAPDELEAARALRETDLERSYDLLSRYVQTRPCAWEAQLELAALALTREQYDVVTRMLRGARWVFKDDFRPHFLYGQALASAGDHAQALRALEQAATFDNKNVEVSDWLAFVRNRISLEQATTAEAPGIPVASHVSRSLLVLLGIQEEAQFFVQGYPLHNLPGDVALSFLLGSVSQHEAWRTGQPPLSGDAAARALADRVELFDDGGEPLGIGQTIGDVPDPGIVTVLLYREVHRDPTGRIRRQPSAEEALWHVRQVSAVDSELHNKVTEHKKSSAAFVKAFFAG